VAADFAKSTESTDARRIDVQKPGAPAMGGQEDEDMNHMDLPTSPTPGSFLRKLDAFLLATHRASMWVGTGASLILVGCYAACSTPPAHRGLDVAPDHGGLHLPIPAPVGPLPADAELIASAQ
jgi:hypothetical protein